MYIFQLAGKGVIDSECCCNGEVYFRLILIPHTMIRYPTPTSAFLAVYESCVRILSSVTSIHSSSRAVKELGFSRYTARYGLSEPDVRIAGGRMVTFA